MRKRDKDRFFQLNMPVKFMTYNGWFRVKEKKEENQIVEEWLTSKKIKSLQYWLKQMRPRSAKIPSRSKVAIIITEFRKINKDYAHPSFLSFSFFG
jgi:hypothetical protein